MSKSSGKTGSIKRDQTMYMASTNEKKILHFLGVTPHIKRQDSCSNAKNAQAKLNHMYLCLFNENKYNYTKIFEL